VSIYTNSAIELSDGNTQHGSHAPDGKGSARHTRGPTVPSSCVLPGRHLGEAAAERHLITGARGGDLRSQRAEVTRPRQRRPRQH
jgi:hypothetical protein